jgi:hypothetical protein
VEQVFDAWIEATNRTGRSNLTPDRRGRIVRYLRDYPAEDLVDACRGVMKHPFNRGDNDRHQVYTDLDHCLKGPKQIEMFRDIERGILPPPISTNGNGKPVRNEPAGYDAIREVWNDLHPNEGTNGNGHGNHDQRAGAIPVESRQLRVAP